MRPPLLSTALMATGLLAWNSPQTALGLFGVSRRKTRTFVKCGLPACEVMTEHNGGYCCAKHCIEHRQQLHE